MQLRNLHYRQLANEIDLNAVYRKFTRFYGKKIPHFTREAVDAIIDQAMTMAESEGMISLRLREIGGIVRAAGDVCVFTGNDYVQASHVNEALKIKNYR